MIACADIPSRGEEARLDVRREERVPSCDEAAVTGGTATGGAGTGGGAAATGGGGAGTGGGASGIEEALAACEEWRSSYSAVSLILGCNDPDVDDPTYCDEFATNDCLLESGALWACEAPSFMESNCACVDPKNGPFLDCVDDCGAELQALINCFGS